MNVEAKSLNPTLPYAGKNLKVKLNVSFKPCSGFVTCLSYSNTNLNDSCIAELYFGSDVFTPQLRFCSHLQECPEMYETICVLKGFAGLDGSQILENPQILIYHCVSSRGIQGINTWYRSTGLQWPVAVWDTEIFLNFFRLEDQTWLRPNTLQ